MAEPRLMAVRRVAAAPGVLAFQLPAEVRDRWQQWIARTEQRNPEATWDVTVRVHRKRRSLLQNSKFHAMLTDILVAIQMETGNSFDDCKLGVKWSAVQRRGYPTRPVPFATDQTEPLPSHLGYHGADGTTD